MQTSTHILNEVISNQHHTFFPWRTISTALAETARHKSPESEDILRKVISNQYDVPIEPNSTLPASMEPLELMQTKALLTLCRWDINKHRDVLEKASHSKSTIVSNFARLQTLS